LALKKYIGDSSRSQRKCPYRRHRAAEEGKALVAVQQLFQHDSCERGARTRSRSRQVALGAYANLMLRKLPGSRLEAFQSTLVKPAHALLLCPLRLKPRS